jgi:hypothetical protein
MLPCSVRQIVESGRLRQMEVLAETVQMRRVLTASQTRRVSPHAPWTLPGVWRARRPAHVRSSVLALRRRVTRPIGVVRP